MFHKIKKGREFKGVLRKMKGRQKQNVKSDWLHVKAYPEKLLIFISCSILLMSKILSLPPRRSLHTSTFIKISPSECSRCYAGAVTHIMGDGISFHSCCSAGSNSNLELNFLLKNIAFHVECQLLKCSVPCLTSH